MIKNIVFDLGGVLVGLNRGACEEAFRQIGFNDFGKILNEYVQGGFFLEYEKGEISTEEFIDIIRSYIDPQMRESVTNTQIVDAMGAFLEDIPGYKLDYLIELNKRYRLFMLSNTNPIAIEIVRPLFLTRGIPIESYFEELFLSYQMKMAKPDDVIFENVIKSAGLDASQTLFVDDSPLNIETAKRLGFKTLLYSPLDNLTDEVNRILC
ncbi:MAG: HAD family phosphatase [Bacteroidetes bacterium HGW-Bacteroidetes-8]|jgi:putative hydrolase of the HAD superfamily|nr:MAG: HAD family phosphatase [Bacteroidetes bacterium HGW-Bacteroidetes-8]